MRNVIVLNQFAIPRSETGGARHVNLFGRLDNWEPLYVASNRRHYSQERYRTDDRHFRLVWVPRHRRQLSRILGWGVYAAQAFAITVTRRRVDVVYGSSPHLLAPLAGLVAARVRRARFVLEVRDLWPESIVAAGIIRSGSALERALGRLERLLATAADAIVVVTPGWEEHFSALGVAPSRLTVISNGADPEDFRVYEARDALRSELGVDGFTAVFAGSHGPKDGIDLILEAAAQVPEISFLLIGDGTAKRASQDEAARRGLTNVDFRSPVPKSELGRVLAACDVGIHAVAPLTVFSHGMSPNKLFDYMAAGLPIVSNAREALREVTVDGECGRLGDADSLAASLRFVHEESPKQRAEWGERGREAVRARFSRTAAAAHLEALLDTALASARPEDNSRYRIAHVTTAHPATDNRIMRKECASLAGAGLPIALVAVAERDQTLDGVRVIALPRRSGRLARMTLGPLDAWRALRRVRPDLIHVHDPELIPLAVVWRLRHGRCAVYDAHEDLPKQIMGKAYIRRPMRRPLAWFGRRLEVFADRNLDAIVAATPSIARNFTHSRVVVVQNFPWLHDYSELSDPPPGVQPKVVYVGGISPDRGTAEMVQAVGDSRHNAVLLLAGRVAGRAKQVIANASHNRVRYLGLLPASSVPSLVAEASVGLVLLHPTPNYLESQPTKLFEYMAAGRPFIASDFPYWRSLVGPLEAGLFVNPLDVAGISRSLDDLLDDPEAALEMGRRGRAAIIDRFNFERESATLIAMTRALLDG